MRAWITAALCAAILIGGGAAGVRMASSPEKAARGKGGGKDHSAGKDGGAKKEEGEAREARVLPAVRPYTGAFRTHVKGLARLTPAVTITLRAQTAGRLTEVSPHWKPGGRVKKGDLLARVDPRDYRIALKRAKALVKSARAALALEHNRADAAAAEQRLLKEAGEDVSAARAALRGPQKAAAEASVESAEAAQEAAMLDLERTEVRAPFDALILSINADVGSVITGQEALAQLAGLSVYRAEVSIPVAAAAALGGTEQMEAVLTWPDGRSAGAARPAAFSGRADPGSRMTGVILEVDHPTARGLVAGDTLPAEIRGRPLPAGAMRLPQGALQSDGKLYVVTTSGALAFRSVRVIYADDAWIYVEGGVAPEEAVVIGDVPEAAEGMAVKPSFREAVTSAASPSVPEAAGESKSAAVPPSAAPAAKEKEEGAARRVPAQHPARGLKGDAQ